MWRARWHRTTRCRAYLKRIFLAAFQLVSCMLLPRPALLKHELKRIFGRHESFVYIIKHVETGALDTKLGSLLLFL